MSSFEATVSINFGGHARINLDFVRHIHGHGHRLPAVALKGSSDRCGPSEIEIGDDHRTGFH
jgi:hypothetical protein